MNEELKSSVTDHGPMVGLNADDVKNVSGGAMLQYAFTLGLCIGYGIDQIFIKPLWNN